MIGNFSRELEINLYSQLFADNERENLFGDLSSNPDIMLAK